MQRDILIDETGNVHNGWTVIHRVENNKGSSAMWLCRCVCGKEGIVSGGHLRNGGSKSCGCLGWQAASLVNSIDMTGRRYGRLVVIKRHEITVCGATWECKCDCGNTTIVIGKSLRRGLTKSCGCLHRELMSLPVGEAAFNGLLLRMKSAARKRGYEWRLSREQVFEITHRNCFYCGIEPRQEYVTESNTGTYIYNGIDRIDNSLGYIIDNVVACCGQCNFSKGNGAVGDFRDWIIRTYNHLCESSWKHATYSAENTTS